MNLIGMNSKSILISSVICLLSLLPLAHQGAVAQSSTPKFEAGAQYSLLDFHAFPFNGHESGFGGRFTYNFSKYVAAEAQFDFFPWGKDISRLGFGGKTLGVFGVKAGMRRKHLGVFGKARPGFIHFNHVPPVVCLGDLTPCPFPAKTNFAFNFGGVFEYYPSRRVVVRIDAGDTIIHDQGGVFSTRHNFQFSSGVGLRF